MRILSAFIFFSILTITSQAQHEYDNWYFGSGAGINFTSGSPVVLIDGMTFTTEGTAVMSDTAGNLLFYTDGVTVWNKNHMMMVNGNNLHGGNSSTQSALIVKQPASDSLYYIFTVGDYGAYGFSYSVADMSLQSGLGEVILKNIVVSNNSTEKLTGARDANGNDYWILIHVPTSTMIQSYLVFFEFILFKHI